MNNVVVFFTVVNFGGWDQAFIGAETTGDPVTFALDAGLQIAAFALLWWQAGRAKVRSTYQPVALSAVPGWPARAVEGLPIGDQAALPSQPAPVRQPGQPD